MVQTPTQRRANAKYAHTNERRMGKPESSYRGKKDKARSPVGTVVVAVLIFVIVVPLLLEPLKLAPGAWEYVLSLLARVGLLKR